MLLEAGRVAISSVHTRPCLWVRRSGSNYLRAVPGVDQKPLGELQQHLRLSNPGWPRNLSVSHSSINGQRHRRRNGNICNSSNSNNSNGDSSSSSSSKLHGSINHCRRQPYLKKTIRRQMWKAR
mmetsp:Transcript_9047/g.27116  ORF Transcript_9047/g.27116 Transcript_9047/m.27116 type:complete len:124 (+) Transcript_9047:590-961(+)